MVDAGAEIEDDFQISKWRQQSVRRAPNAGIGDIRRIADMIGPQPDVARGEFAPENIVILGGLRTVDRKEDGARGHDRGYCATTPAAAVSRLKAAANSARV